MNEYNETNLNLFIKNELDLSSSIHGIGHFVNVEAFGLLLASHTGADVEVVKWFAYLHDCQRNNDGHDYSHGPKAAWYIGQIRHTYLSELTTEQVSILRMACRWHTEGSRFNNPTIDSCIDADRLDLPRVGITLNPQRMATKYGMELAEKPYLENLELISKFRRKILC